MEWSGVALVVFSSLYIILSPLLLLLTTLYYTVSLVLLVLVLLSIYLPVSQSNKQTNKWNQRRHLLLFHIDNYFEGYKARRELYSQTSQWWWRRRSWWWLWWPDEWYCSATRNIIDSSTKRSVGITDVTASPLIVAASASLLASGSLPIHLILVVSLESTILVFTQ